MPTGTFSIPPYQLIGSSVYSLCGNPGLVYIKEFSTSGTTNPQFTDCFSNAYESYQIVFKIGSSTNGYFQMKFLQNATALGNVHEYALTYVAYATGIASVGATGQASMNLWIHGGVTQSFAVVTVHGPSVAAHTAVDIMAEGGGNSFAWGSGRTTSTSVVNGFQMTNSGGGTVNGSVYVYGIRG
jgi:hypothetical protein